MLANALNAGAWALAIGFVFAALVFAAGMFIGIRALERENENEAKVAAALRTIAQYPGSLKEYCERATLTAMEKGWHDQPREFGTVIALIHSELSEALEEWRSGRPVTELYLGAGGKPEGIPAELADALIRIFNLCGYENIDLVEAVERKMAYNATRKYRHGGKIA